MASSINTAVNTTTAYDATSVALGNVLIREAYARDILFLAQPLMHYFRFVTYREELGVQPGLTINIPTYRNIKRGKQLTEGVKMETQAMSAFNKQITVHEWGNALAFTELAMRASFRDLMADAVTQLSRDMALTVDCYLRDVAMAGATIDGVSTPVIYGRKDSSATKITSRASITTDSILSVATLKDGLELLATANAPKFSGSYYVNVCHPHQSRKLRDDPAWIDGSTAYPG
jgi:N4-gp56 family major capsid protein